MKFIIQILTWWNDQSLGTRIYTWRNGQFVGEDAQGNKYYETKDKKRRWAIYNGIIDGSRIPADWHGWLHHTFDECPGTEPLTHKKWEKEHQNNVSGSDAAYHPTGSIFAKSPNSSRDYEAWQPE